MVIGSIYYWGQGAAIDYPRAMAAYKVGGEGGIAGCQWQVGLMYCNGLGVAVDCKLARPWLEKAAAQDQPNAVASLGAMYSRGPGATPRGRRARELIGRAVDLGCSEGVDMMQTLIRAIATVTNSRRPPHTIPTPLLQAHALVCPISSRSSPPSWTSGWRSTARAAPT